MSRLFALTALVVSLLSVAAFCEEQDPKDFDAKGFVFYDVPFRSSIEDFRKKYPNALENARFCDKKNGIVVYETRGGKELPHDWILWTFHDGVLIRFRAGYSPDGFKRAGGLDAFVERLKKRLGECHNGRNVNDSDLGGEGIQMDWNFPDAARTFSLEVYPQYAYFNGSDLDGEKTESQKKASEAKLGF